MSSLVTSPDFVTLDHALSQTDEKEMVIMSVLMPLLLEEMNQKEIGGSAANTFDQAISRLELSIQVVSSWWNK